MRIGYHYGAKSFGVAFAGLVWLVVLWSVDLEVLHKVAWCGAGTLAGWLLAVTAWRRMVRRIDARRTLITYFADTPVYALLVTIFVLSQLPRAPFKVAFFAVRHPTIVQVSLLALAACAFAYNVSMLISIAHYERAHGPLRVKELHARSVTGLEGMLGRVATVTVPCRPDGKVQVRSEIWDAVSVDGKPIPAGARVVIKDVEGLTVIVQRRGEDAA